MEHKKDINKLQNRTSVFVRNDKIEHYKGGTNMYREIFPQRIKEARERAGYSQKEIAEITKINRTSICKYENGKAEPNLEQMGILAQFYNVSINWLLGVTLEEEIKVPKNKIK